MAEVRAPVALSSTTATASYGSRYDLVAESRGVPLPRSKNEAITLRDALRSEIQGRPLVDPSAPLPATDPQAVEQRLTLSRHGQDTEAARQQADAQEGRCAADGMVYRT